MYSADSLLYLSNDDMYLFAAGKWLKSFEKMGAHPAFSPGGIRGFHFAVWAPDVESVSVVGDFNGWDTEANHLACTSSGGIWEGFVAGVDEWVLYKYFIRTKNGEGLYKADPYAFYAEIPPGTASRTIDLDSYSWHDEEYLEKRARHNPFKEPLNIFEVHLGSWRRHGTDPQGPPRPDGTYAGPGDPIPTPRGYPYSYEELSRELVDYVKDMGYSHIEIMPIMEHPFDGSWGYQGTGYYAATSRYGDPHQFMAFIDACHTAGIGVILDWVPGGFCADAHGLANFNGTMLYESSVHPNWGTHKFDFSRGEVRSFLISNALFWAGYFHADGLRIDGVTSMLYMNFGIEDAAKKRFNEDGTEEDRSASAFLREINTQVGRYFPGVITIAEESTAWPLVTYPPSAGGLGFHYKWDMGWMNDTLHYIQSDFPFRSGAQRLLTFSTMYQFNENFILPLSHDEVVNGKSSLITRQPGNYWAQFAGMRALALYQMCHAGAKLNFMGNEIAQFIEWRYYEGIEYFLAEKYDAHRKHQQFIKALNHFYNDHPALWQNECSEEGFEWIDADDAKDETIAFIRKGDNPKDELVILINFDINAHEGYKLGMPKYGDYQEIFCSDDQAYGGSGVCNTGILTTSPEPKSGRNQSLTLRVPPLGGIILSCVCEKSHPHQKDSVRPKARRTHTSAP